MFDDFLNNDKKDKDLDSTMEIGKSFFSAAENLMGNKDIVGKAESLLSETDNLVNGVGKGLEVAGEMASTVNTVVDTVVQVAEGVGTAIEVAGVVADGCSLLI